MTHQECLANGWVFVGWDIEPQNPNLTLTDDRFWSHLATPRYLAWNWRGKRVVRSGKCVESYIGEPLLRDRMAAYLNPPATFESVIASTFFEKA